MKDNIVRKKSFAFAIRIVNLYKYLSENKREYVLAKQILKSGTAVGALVREAEYAQSTADFIHKLSVGLKEANETEYWLELLYKTGYLAEAEYNSLAVDCVELIKLLTSIINTSKSGNPGA